MKVRTIQIVYSTPQSAVEREAIANVRKAIKDAGISYKLTERSALKKIQKGTDLLISVGGDGTFLSAAHQIKDSTPILGVNADPKNKEGYLLSATSRTLGSMLKKIANDEVSVVDYPTVEASVNGKKIRHFAINEFFVGSKKAYRTSRYEILLGNRKEVQRSSGVIVATPLGVHAWTSSALGMNVTIPNQSLMFVVREPYERRVFSDYHIKRGLLKSTEHIDIVSHMRDGVIVADSLSDEFQLSFGDRICISRSSKKIRVIKKR